MSLEPLHSRSNNETDLQFDAAGVSRYVHTQEC